MTETNDIGQTPARQEGEAVAPSGDAVTAPGVLTFHSPAIRQGEPPTLRRVPPRHGRARKTRPASAAEVREYARRSVVL